MADGALQPATSPIDIKSYRHPRPFGYLVKRASLGVLPGSFLGGHAACVDGISHPAVTTFRCEDWTGLPRELWRQSMGAVELW